MNHRFFHFFNKYTHKECLQKDETITRLWEANKKLMLQNQDLHNRLAVEKIQPVKPKRGRPFGSKNNKK